MSDATLVRSDILDSGSGSIEQALELFDSLDSVDLPFMMGRWRGSEITTGHPQDGVLAATRWYGKEFEDPETVHPLLHRTGSGQLFRVRPRPKLVYMSLRMPILKSKAFRPLSLLITRLLKTNQSQARARMIEYRGKVSATMVYDFLPINDHFRRIDENTVLGMMDFKGLENPFPFVLRRDES
jgi:hypothetical protein